MKGKLYFNLDSITTVNVQLERESDYKWYEAAEPKQKYFLGIPCGKTEGRNAGWSDRDTEDYWYGLDSTKPSSYFDKYTWYRVDETEKKVYHKSNVKVHLGPKEYVSHTFNSNDEALAWAEDIVKRSGKLLEPIILT